MKTLFLPFPQRRAGDAMPRHDDRPDAATTETFLSTLVLIGLFCCTGMAFSAAFDLSLIA